MSSGKTSRLGLNQWVPTDPFRMEEMNADNSKIDAAIAAIPISIVKLGQIVTTAAADKIDIDLSTIQWSKYRRVYIISKIKQNASSNLVFYAKVTFGGHNGTDEYCEHSIYDSSYSSWNSRSYAADYSISNANGAPTHNVEVLEIYPEDGCVFRGWEDGVGYVYRRQGGILRSASGSYTPADISALQYLSYSWLAGGANASAVTTLAAGCQFDIYGFLK